ncbi:MAG: hypothetical protein KAI43_02690 [Candidatus Aureabacteria bacterium]|nr:hypothetical protein [Candidatus Auribacterota bacterium]
MNKDEIVTLSLKITGIYGIIQLITKSNFLIGSLFTVIRTNTIEGLLYAIFFALIPLVLFIYLIYVLLFKTPSLSKKILASESNEKSNPINSKEIQVLAFSIIGVWVLASTIPSFIQTLAYYSFSKENSELAKTVNITLSTRTHFFGLSLKLIIGLYLFIGSKGLVNLWHKLQSTKGMPSN